MKTIASEPAPGRASDPPALGSGASAAARHSAGAPASGHTAEIEALIKEARRRHRRRQLMVGLTAVAVTAAGIGAFTAVRGAGQRRPASRPRPVAASNRPAPRVLPGAIPASVDTTLVMWPVDADQYGGLSIDNLRTRHVWQPLSPGMDSGEYAPILPVGQWIVWVADDNEVSVVSAEANQPGTPRALGKTLLFAPSATPDQVWLQYGFFGTGSNTVRSVDVVSGHASSPIVLPAGLKLIAGTAAGLLVSPTKGGPGALQLWKPGATPITLPHSAWAQAFAVSRRFVAYDTGCRGESTAPELSYDGNYGYSACRTLRVFDVVTGRLRSFAAPSGTSGWVPSHGGYWSVSAIAQSGTVIAAEAVLPPDSRGVARVYVMHLAGPAARPVAVPSSAAFLLSVTAWSANGAWLFYQGPGIHLWGYQVRTGRVRSSATPCCQYAVLSPITPPSG
jgi:hypothetical protein